MVTLNLFCRAIMVKALRGMQNVCGHDIDVVYKYKNARTRRRPSSECLLTRNVFEQYTLIVIYPNICDGYNLTGTLSLVVCVVKSPYRLDFFFKYDPYQLCSIKWNKSLPVCCIMI